MASTDIRVYPENYEELSTDAALRGENIACRLRHLIYASAGIRKKEYLTEAATVHGIRIELRENIIEITLPGLLPKRNQRRSTEFLLDPLYFSLRQYADTHTLPKFNHCVVCFSHIYGRHLPARRVRDYDNLELKQILDVISAFIMVDDTGLLCDAYNTTEFGETDCTRVSIMDKNNFARWLAERENSMESISDL
jgi:hypothetical protein